jgi:2-hydroxy-6-oxonona-2,4-dienedioate hydrolase
MTSNTLNEAETSRFVDTPKWRIHYHEAGEGEPLVMLHGSGPGATGWSNFRANMEVLSKSYRTIAVDMPGWGKSDSAPPEDRDHVEALLGFLDALGIERPVLIGNSMGGMTSVRFACEHRDRVRSLVVMGAPSPSGQPIFSPGGAPTEGLKVLVEGYEDPSPETLMKLVRIMCFDQSFASEALATQRSEAARANPEHLSNYLAARATNTAAGNARYPEMTPILPLLTIPVLVIHGRDDRTVHFEHGLRLVSMIPNSRLVVFNQCGHWAQLEHAAEFNRLVTDFVAHH